MSRGPFPVPGRLLLLTVDCEAFAPEVLPLWLEAMHYWVVCARRTVLRFCFFLSVEDALRIRATGQGEYRRFLAVLRALVDAGSLFYAHNHFVFDPDSGKKKLLAQEPADIPRGYGKRKSIFYDAVHRHRLDLKAWMTAVRESYEKVLSDAGCRSPEFPIFRAGGWDYGDSRSDLSRYIEGLVAAGFRGDSSACRGTFGTPTWHVGSEFGRNVFRLDGGVLEIAPTWSLDMSAPPLSLWRLRDFLALGRQRGIWKGGPGACVVVLHFDHLFRAWSGRSLEAFGTWDAGVIRARIDRLFRLLDLLRSLLRLSSGTFDALEDVGSEGGKRLKTSASV
ncbi:MAG TPA: hypothetical protein VLM91_18950 [Candidatus Methylomirabilis sp.]|nr:hypothetical protein [Candidatus Methylomirabilis sp.]